MAHGARSEKLELNHSCRDSCEIRSEFDTVAGLRSRRILSAAFTSARSQSKLALKSPTQWQSPPTVSQHMVPLQLRSSLVPYSPRAFSICANLEFGSWRSSFGPTRE